MTEPGNHTDGKWSHFKKAVIEKSLLSSAYVASGARKLELKFWEGILNIMFFVFFSLFYLQIYCHFFFLQLLVSKLRKNIHCCQAPWRSLPHIWLPPYLIHRIVARHILKATLKNPFISKTDAWYKMLSESGSYRKLTKFYGNSMTSRIVVLHFKYWI